MSEHKAELRRKKEIKGEEVEKERGVRKFLGNWKRYGKEKQRRWKEGKKEENKWRGKSSGVRLKRRRRCKD